MYSHPLAAFADRSFGEIARPLALVLVPLLATLFLPDACHAQIKFGLEPIKYDDSPSDDDVARLMEKVRAGQTRLEFDDSHGYLPALLDALEIPVSSQVLVFSKTSFQLRRISPKTPRALYFNDESYVGWVQDGDVLEIMSTDPQLGQVFYTLEQTPSAKPQIVRDRGHCLTCHASSRTQGVPGVLVRSAYVASDGQPHFGSGTFTTDHKSPFSERFGGWYVTGTHGEMQHMGNTFTPKRRRPTETVDSEGGANVTDLSDKFDVERYLSPHSDLIALMVLEHQSQMHNFLTLANYETRDALHHDGIMNRALERPDDFISDTTKRRIASAGDKLLKYMLFRNEFELASPVAGTSDFARQFQEYGPRDSKGRSLRDLDMQTRMFKHPCSFLIYSPAFDGLPEPVLTYVTERLIAILTNDDDSDDFAHLSRTDRESILEILKETKPQLWDALN